MKKYVRFALMTDWSVWEFGFGGGFHRGAGLQAWINIFWWTPTIGIGKIKKITGTSTGRVSSDSPNKSNTPKNKGDK